MSAGDRQSASVATRASELAHRAASCQNSARAVRVLVVSSDAFPPTRVDVSVLFGDELARRGHRIDWILQSEDACHRPYETDWGGGRVYVGPTDLGNSLFNRVRKHLRGILHDLRMFGLLRRGHYDLIEVKDKFLSGLFAVLASRWHGVPLIYWLSFPFPESYLERARDGTARYPLLYRVRGWVFSVILYRVLLRAAVHSFVQSEQMRTEIAARGIPPDRMTAVPMGVRSGIVPLSRADRTLLAPELRPVLYLGALARVRRIDFLIRVIAKVRERVPSAVLVLVGSGDDPRDEQVLDAEIRRLDVADGVRLVGQVPQAVAFQYVSESDVCLSPLYPTPIYRVASPTKLVEYMALGKVVVANDHPEQRQIIEDSGAGICVKWDEQEWADAIVRLLEDPDLAARMGHRGPGYVNTHRTYSVLADLVERQLLALVPARKNRSHAG